MQGEPGAFWTIGWLKLVSLGKIATAVLFGALCTGCVDHVSARPDDEAMRLYRDCMNGMPQRWDNIPTSELNANPATLQSVGAEVENLREAKTQIECARIAGWEEK